MYVLTAAYADLGFWFLAGARALTGIGLPMIFLSITTAAYDGLPAGRTDQASALINAAAQHRRLDRWCRWSPTCWPIARSSTRGRLAEDVVPTSPQYQDTLHQVTHYFASHGSSLIESQGQAIAWIGQQLQLQASFLAFMDAFWVLMLLALSAVPLALALRNVKLDGGAAPAGH